MNIFYIPSWYPSADEPLSGIFIKDQINGITTYSPSTFAGISIWGQKDAQTLLYSKDPINTLKKLRNFKNLKPQTDHIKSNWTQYYNPALTWTKKVAGGNIREIIKSNEYNFEKFEKEVGKVALIHAFITFPGGYIASKLSEKFNIPFVITEEMSPFRPDVFFNLHSKIEEEVILPLKKASAVIAVSPFSAAQIEDIVKKPVLFIPNMVNEDFFVPTPNLIKNRNFTFFTLGRMVEQKGIPVLLDAIARIASPNVTFRIGGAGEELTKYIQMSKQLSLENIEWLGELNRKEALIEFQNCDAFVLPSLHESMGVVFAEAIACGKPIIATRCGGPESIVDESNGLLAEVGNGEDLAKKINWMVENHSAYDPKIIRQDFLNRFSSRVVSSRIVQLYKEILDKTGAAIKNQ